MTTWIWSRADHKGLARFANEKAAWDAAALDLGLDRLTEEAKAGGRKRIVEAIYEKLCSRHPRITYDREEFLSHGDDRQKIRTPRTILNTDYRGTCLDLSLLFCALCLNNDLLPFLIIAEGHAFAAVLLSHGRKDQGADAWDAFGRLGFTTVRDSEGEIRERDTILDWVKQGILLPVESTGFAYSEALPSTSPEGRGRSAGFLDFERAVAAGREHLEEHARPFQYAIDIHYLQFIGFEAHLPPNESPVAIQRSTAKPTIPPEYLAWLTARVFAYGGFEQKTTRDRLAGSIHSYFNEGVRLRSEEPRVDLQLILAAFFQRQGAHDYFEPLLAAMIPDMTRRGHLISYAQDLAALAALPAIFSRVELSLRDLRRCYTASLCDPQRAREVSSVQEALRDLLDLPPGRRKGWRSVSEFIERVARLCKVDTLHRWVEEYEMDPVKRTELYSALDREETSAVEYVVVDVPSLAPDALEYWRRFDRNNVPQVHDFLLCPKTAAPLEDAIALLAENASDWSTNVRLEMFVPIDMLASNIDQWLCDIFEGNCSLGEQHVLAIRWRERARDGKRQPQWRAFVAGLAERSSTHFALGWLEQGLDAGLNLAERVRCGACGDCLAFPFIPFSVDMRTPHSHLKAALGGGMAYGMWLRREPGDWRTFRNDLAKVFEDAGAPEEVPARIKAARRDAANHSDPNHPFCNLTLFWDEPHRNPWKQGQLAQPGQKPKAIADERLENLYRSADAP